MATLTRDNGKTKIEILKPAAVAEWIKKHEEEAKADEAKSSAAKKWLQKMLINSAAQFIVSHSIALEMYSRQSLSLLCTVHHFMSHLGGYLVLTPSRWLL